MTIDVEEFVNAALTKVLRAISNAQNDEEVGEQIAPMVRGDVKIDPAYGVAAHNGQLWSVMEIDIAITASSETEASGGAGLKIPVIEAQVGAKGSVTSTQNGVSRIKFSVPIVVSQNPNR